VAGFGRAKIKRKSKNQARRGERDFDQTAFTLFQKATGIKHSKTRRWKCVETPGVEPVFLDQEQAIDYAQTRARTFAVAKFASSIQPALFNV
jgi:hypothetical protein